ncbi:MAG: ATP-binding cassette domain-containing protein [Candidatus Lokiarchaeota archaeon]|nr:ATP-binding cassette domain-containing protein [Candidatus Lokiarchaeota archaeon]
MVHIELKNISKNYGKIKALDNVSLEIKNEEFFIILGPTGAGKTTLLKIIAGLIKPDSGKVFFDGKDVTDKRANERNLGYVFENYALFPHMNVQENICYSGRVNNRPEQQTNLLAEQVLMITLLKGRNNAYPEQLSGGMQQRVALCRALMNLEKTGLLLLDEPLKALDAGLRMSLRKEILDMVKSSYLQLTAIHVTNEMEEAMMMADRIAIFDESKLIQVGTPFELYYRPHNLFVANFMSEINYFEGICVKNKSATWNTDKKPKSNNRLFAEIQDTSEIMPIDLGEEELFVVYIDKQTYNAIEDNEKVILIVRANHMKIRIKDRTSEKHNSFLGKIKRRKFMGVFYRFEIICQVYDKEKKIIVTIPATNEIHKYYLEGKSVTVYFPRELGTLFKHPGKKTIQHVLKLE